MIWQEMTNYRKTRLLCKLGWSNAEECSEHVYDYGLHFFATAILRVQKSSVLSSGYVHLPKDLSLLILYCTVKHFTRSWR